ncbi:hypothetical protein PMZ80_008653 [Knufia obscura]|uniref:Uncharacterized protein n=1 Tax=Knufia obscura TaxID=1635080 RepID=A0ABR0RGM3_9EURO|nr:hypothetical protein PMZ80_008653 [Knufia obscura]
MARNTRSAAKQRAAQSPTEQPPAHHATVGQATEDEETTHPETTTSVSIPRYARSARPGRPPKLRSASPTYQPTSPTATNAPPSPPAFVPTSPTAQTHSVPIKRSSSHSTKRRIQKWTANPRHHKPSPNPVDRSEMTTPLVYHAILRRSHTRSKALRISNARFVDYEDRDLVDAWAVRKLGTRILEFWEEKLGDAGKEEEDGDVEMEMEIEGWVEEDEDGGCFVGVYEEMTRVMRRSEM